MSGIIHTSYDNNTRFYMRWWLISQEVNNNRSQVGWEIGLQGVAGRSAYWYSNAIRINSGYVDGAHVCGSSTYSNITLQGDGLRPLRSGSLWIGHNSDGGKSFGMSVSGWLYGAGDRSSSGSFGLPTIPRNSQVTTNAGSYTLGSPVTIHTNRKSTSFSHTITLRLHNASGTVLQTFNSVGDAVTWNPSAAQITTMQNAIPNTNNLTLHITQYNHQVAANSVAARTLTLTNANPTFSDFIFKDSNTTTAGITGNDQILVKGKSTLQVTVPSASKMVAIKGASELFYSIGYDGASNQEDYTTGDVTSSFNTVVTTGNRTILVSAFDSRKNSTQASKSVMVYDYAPPTIKTVLTRENNFGSNTTLHIEGKYTPLTINAIEKNSLVTGSLEYRYKDNDTTTWGAWTSRAFTATGGSYSITDFVIALDNQKKYNFEFRVSDLFGQVTATNNVEVGTPIMFVGQKDGTSAVGINKMPEQGALDVQGDIYSNGVKTARAVLYSIAETDTGDVWIDGNIIYRKTIQLGSLPNSTLKKVPHGVSGLSTLVKIYGTAVTSTVHIPLPFVSPTAQNSMAINLNGSSLDITTGVDRTSFTGVATIEYTKV